MMSRTKAERAKIVLQVMREQQGIPKPLGTWLAVLNSRLSAKYSLRSTKELAHVFKFMSCVLRGTHNNCFIIIKEKKMRSEGRTKIATVFYTFKCSENCIHRREAICSELRKMKNE